MTHLVVEQRFAQPLSDEEYAAISNRIDPCLATHGVRWQRSCFAVDRSRMICEFEAPDAEAVRQAYRSAQVPFERVWAAEVFAPRTATA